MNAPAPSPFERPPEGEVPTRWICFELGAQQYGVEILRTVEVLAGAAIEPIPHAGAGILGVANLHGRIITVLDPRQGLGVPATSADTPDRFVVVDYGGEPVALRVDRLSAVRSILPQAIQMPTGQPGAQPVLGVVSDREPPLTLLDIDRLVASELRLADGAPAASAREQDLP